MRTTSTDTAPTEQEATNEAKRTIEENRMDRFMVAHINAASKVKADIHFVHSANGVYPHFKPIRKA
jgi:hypothetical protein